MNEYKILYLKVSIYKLISIVYNFSKILINKLRFINQKLIIKSLNKIKNT